MSRPLAFALHIQPIEAVLENAAVVHDGQYARPEQVEVVEVKEHGQRVHFAAGHLHAVRLIIVGPVAEVAQSPSSARRRGVRVDSE